MQSVDQKKHTEKKKGGIRRDGALMEDGGIESLEKSSKGISHHVHRHEIAVQYRNLTFWNEMSKLTIDTVGSTIKAIFLGGEKKHRVNIINDLTGRILPKRMTLVMGPPGCGKSTFIVVINRIMDQF